jgi:hypothetical protein
MGTCRIEPLESRQFLHALNLTPLVRASGPSPFLGHPITANDPAITINAETLPDLAVDPNDPQHLVGAWIQDFARGVVSAVSFDGGDSWQSVAVPGTTIAAGGVYPHANNPRVCFGADGDVYLTMVGHDLPYVTNPNAVLISKSTNGGLTWGAPTTFANQLGHFPAGPFLTADPTNADLIYAIWTTKIGNQGINVATKFTRTTDGGQTWEPVRTIYRSANVDDNAGHQILVLPSGTLVDVFKEDFWAGQTVQRSEVSLIRSTDGGTAWSTRIPVAQLPTSAVLDPENGLRVVTGINGTIDAAVDPMSGEIYAVWKTAGFSNGEFDSIAFSMSTDGGLSWSTPIKINQTPDSIPAANRQAFIPSVAVNDDGVVAVTYYDFRNNTPAAGLPTDYWMVHAHPSDGLTNPASWSSENRLTDTSFNMEDSLFLFNQYIVGGYQGLVAQSGSFGALFAMPLGGDHGSIFYRDLMPAGAASAHHDVVRGSARQFTATFARTSLILAFNVDADDEAKNAESLIA